VDLVHHPRHLVPPELGLPGPSVVTVHDVLPLSDPRYFSQLILRRYGPLARSAVRRARLVITSTQHAAGEVARLLEVDRDRIRVTPWGVEAHFRPVEAPDRPPYVLCVGTLEPRKNLIGALRAFELVADDFPEHTLVLVGGHGWKGGPLERALASTRAKVERTGHVSDEELVRLYSGADCLLFPSFAEGFGFPIVEAMACGAPVIAGDRTSMPEVAGDAAVLVDPSDDEALASALASVLSSAERRAELRDRGLARAAQFSWAECARLTVDAYGDALAG
jgi:glycosyltransferase involved in cell wall biosynthesis